MDNDRSIKLLKLVQQQAGISRRKARDLIDQGAVQMDGETISQPFTTVTPGAVLWLRGHPLPTVPPRHHVYRYHKPVGLLCSHDDPHCGLTVGRILRLEGFIGYTWAGRLDQDAEGLILLSNDGQLIHRLTHPRYEIEKTYHVSLSTTPPRSRMEEIFNKMKRGIRDHGTVLTIVSAKIHSCQDKIVLTLSEGKKNEIKRLFSHFDLEVVRLKRTAIGPITLGDLPSNEILRLDPTEQRLLYVNAGLKEHMETSDQHNGDR